MAISHPLKGEGLFVFPDVITLSGYVRLRGGSKKPEWESRFRDGKGVFVGKDADELINAIPSSR